MVLTDAGRFDALRCGGELDCSWFCMTRSDDGLVVDVVQIGRFRFDGLAIRARYKRISEFCIGMAQVLLAK